MKPIVGHVKDCDISGCLRDCQTEDEMQCGTIRVLVLPIYEEEAVEPDMVITLRTGNRQTTLPWTFREIDTSQATEVPATLVVTPART